MGWGAVGWSKSCERRPLPCPALRCWDTQTAHPPPKPLPLLPACAPPLSTAPSPLHPPLTLLQIQTRDKFRIRRREKAAAAAATAAAAVGTPDEEEAAAAAAEAAAAVERMGGWGRAGSGGLGMWSGYGTERSASDCT